MKGFVDLGMGVAIGLKSFREVGSIKHEMLGNKDSNSPRNKDFQKYIFLHHVVVGLDMKVPICMGFLQKNVETKNHQVGKR